MLLNLRLKIQDFFRKNKFRIFILIIVLSVIITVNKYLGKMKEIEPPKTNYQPHTAVITGDEIKSIKTKNTLEEKINGYMDACGNRDYQTAYDMLSDECKEICFKKNISFFKEYIDSIYDKNKVYSIQDYSNKNNVYVYKVTISEDILASGLNNGDSEVKYEEKIVVTKDGDDYKLAIRGFINAKDLEIVSENSDMKIFIKKIVTYYDTVTYTVEVKNNSESIIMLQKDGEGSSVLLSLDGDLRKTKLDNYGNNDIVIYQGNTKSFDLTFSKYFDEDRNITELIFNRVRLLKEYTGVQSLWEKESNDLDNAYSATIKL